MVIRSPRVLLPTGIHAAEIVVDGGYISTVRIDPPSTDIAHRTSNIDHRTSGIEHRTSSVIFPGLVDTHVHVNEPGRADWEGFATASAAAAAGGITTIVDMPLNSVPATTTVAGLEAKRAAARASIVNVEFWGGVIPGNSGELDALADAGVRGFKCFLSPSGVDEFPLVSEADLRVALPILARRKLPLLVHAEDPACLLEPGETARNAIAARRYATWLASRPPRAEVEAIAMLVRLSRELGARIHVVHVASADALDVLQRARSEGLPITAETCPHYLSFCAEEIADARTDYKCAPPIRERRHRDALWQALEAGVLDLVASDHSPCPPAMKGDGDFLAAWGGIASLELSLAATWTAAAARGIGLERIAEWMCAAPARLAGLHDRGTIAPGKRADFILWDPEAEFTVTARTLHHRHKLTPYEGMRLKGIVRQTYREGARILDP